jgi:hypothetical protein
MKPVKTTRDRAAVLAGLIESAKKQQAGAGERGQQPSVAVKILAAIPAGDSGQKSAMLMTRNGGTLQETGQPVLVRHVGEGAVSAGAIVTPEPCGRLGLCFARSVQVVRIAPIQQRMIQAVGPIAGELGTEDTDWEFGTFQGQPYQQLAGGYFADLDFGSEATVTAPSFIPTWTLKMKPFRWKCHGYGEAFWGGQRDNQYRITGANGYSTLLDMLTSNFRPYMQAGLQAKVAEVFHYSPAVAKQVLIPINGFLSTRFPRLFPAGRTEVQVTFTHYRVWMDGVDKTGIVVSAGPGVGTQITAAIPEADYSGKQMLVDLWVTITIQDSGVVADQVKQVLWIDHRANFRTADLYNSSTTPWSSDTGARFTLDFDSNGPDGLTTIDTVDDPSAGWVLTAAGTISEQLTLRKTSTGAEFVMDWITREIPRISYKASSASTRFWYLPADNSKFEPLRFENGNSVTVGTWVPPGPIAFNLIGQEKAYPSVNARYLDLKGSGGLPGSDDPFTAVPQVITLTQIA